MKAREKTLTLLLSLCIGVLLIAFFAMIIFPKYQEMDKKADEATAAKNRAESALAAAKKLDPDEISKQLSNLKARIPSSFELPNATFRIGEVAEANNLLWKQGTPEDQSTVAAPTGAAAPTAGQTNIIAPQLTRYDYTIVVEGQMTDFIKFMSDVTDKGIGRIIIINSLDVQFNNDEGVGVIEATLKLQVVGWDKGADIGSDGCTDTGQTGSNNADDPNCNRTSVSKSKSDESDS